MAYQVIIISGVARSGKSNLAYSLHKELGYSHLSTDDIRFMAEKRLTEYEEPFEKEKRNDKVWPYVEALIRTRLKYGRDGDGFIFEGDVLRPSRIAKLKGIPNIKMLCIAYPNISVEDKMKQIRDYKDTHDWTDKMSDEELRIEVEKLINRSKEFEKECIEHVIKFIDVSTYHEGIQEAKDYIQLQLIKTS